MAWLLRLRWLVPLVLAVSLGVTFLLYRLERKHDAVERRAALEFDLRDLVGRIEQRMLACEQVLRGAQGLFTASPQLGAAGLQTYVDALRLGVDFAGMQGLAVARVVTAEQRDAHVAAMRRAGATGYDISPPGKRELYAPVVFGAPHTEANRRALGFDPHASPLRRAAMEQARDSGVAAITAKVRLVIDADAAPSQPSGDAADAGFVMFLPLYDDGLRHATIDARRAHLTGWVLAPFRMNELLASLYGELPAGLNIQIHDGVDLVPANLMYRSLPARPGRGGVQATEYLTVAGHTWTLTLQGRATEPADGGLDSAQIIAVAGGLTSVLLTLLTWGLIKGRDLAKALARRMTQELQESETRYRRLAQYDELTQLPNRALFGDRLRHAVAHARREHARLALMFIDLDRFKPVNDAHGHPAGDLLLRAVARRLVDCVRESDTVARIGGDEFVVLLPGIHADADALGVAEKIRHALRRSFDLGEGRVVEISASIGVAYYPDHGKDETQLSVSADDAMYHAKEAGRDRICVAASAT